MIKPNLFLDFDNTLVHSIKAYCETYNHILYQDTKNSYIPAKWYDVKEYNFKDQCPLIENPEDIFAHPYFFKVLELINGNTYEILEKLNQKYNIIICTIGTPKNLANKSLWS
jgi:5'(3')-deoxyribonucleotidase